MPALSLEDVDGSVDLPLVVEAGVVGAISIKHRTNYSIIWTKDRLSLIKTAISLGKTLTYLYND